MVSPISLLFDQGMVTLVPLHSTRYYMQSQCSLKVVLVSLHYSQSSGEPGAHKCLLEPTSSIPTIQICVLCYRTGTF